MNTHRLTQILFVLVGLFGVMAFVCACSTNDECRMTNDEWKRDFPDALSVSDHPSWGQASEQVRPAIPVTSNRASNGQYKALLCPVCNQPAIEHWVGGGCANGHRFETENTKLKLSP